MRPAHWYHAKYQRPYRRPWRKGWTAEEWQTLERLRLAGYHWVEIAQEIGRTETACRVAWSRYGPSPEYLAMQGLLWAVERDPMLVRRMSRLRGAGLELQEVGKRVLQL